MPIRNFSIIAHIDHGKSTLADRLLQATKAVDERDAKAQLLDSMELERERGITIKASAVTVHHEYSGEDFQLNFIDTPGHVDFTYEVSRALTACEGALLVVDSTQGVEAQTVANAYLAIENDLELIPVINKIDLPSADPEKVAMEIEQMLGLPAENCIYCSAKTGEGIRDLLDAICKILPPPRTAEIEETRALIFDSHYDDYRGVVVYFRVFDGSLSKGDRILMMGTNRTFTITEIGRYTPTPEQAKTIGTAEVGYMVAAIKTLQDVRIGDTITLDAHPAKESLPGYEEPKQMVFCDFYPASSESGSKKTEFETLREAVEKLRLNDSSFTFETQHSEALGFGFRCGFLGLLHMEIVQERLEREGGAEIIQTAPTVNYRIEMTDGSVLDIHNPADLPDPSQIQDICEPIVKVEIICPDESIGDLIRLCEGRRGIFKAQKFVSEGRQLLDYELPLAEIIYDFYDKLKSITRGYGTMDYEITEFRKDNLVKVSILVNGTPVEALSLICHRDKAEARTRGMLLKLRKQIDRHQFEIALQAAIGGKIIARETVKSLRKNVTAKCYGGDITRKRKLLEKQKKGKRRMKAIGNVHIPQTAFLAILEQGD
ncbi:MAG: elongation factor 4 [Phycisphaerae bacterium]|nr:elongation factor 4 [Phycisphaerae bacterium]MBT5409472.1 elongation factor 4 [Phycisphaerae bacterium]MBT6164592.1 elongation factor 4 [Phycisphaerae bacterium]